MLIVGVREKYELAVSMTDPMGSIGGVMAGQFV
jgi:hypothetical protein